MRLPCSWRRLDDTEASDSDIRRAQKAKSHVNVEGCRTGDNSSFRSFSNPSRIRKDFTVQRGQYDSFSSSSLGSAPPRGISEILEFFSDDSRRLSETLKRNSKEHAACSRQRSEVERALDEEYELEAARLQELLFEQKEFAEKLAYEAAAEQNRLSTAIQNQREDGVAALYPYHLRISESAAAMSDVAEYGHELAERLSLLHVEKSEVRAVCSNLKQRVSMCRYDAEKQQFQLRANREELQNMQRQLTLHEFEVEKAVPELRRRLQESVAHGAAIHGAAYALRADELARTRGAEAEARSQIEETRKASQKLAKLHMEVANISTAKLRRALVNASQASHILMIRLFQSLHSLVRSALCAWHRFASERILERMKKLSAAEALADVRLRGSCLHVFGSLRLLETSDNLLFVVKAWRLQVSVLQTNVLQDVENSRRLLWSHARSRLGMLHEFLAQQALRDQLQLIFLGWFCGVCENRWSRTVLMNAQACSEAARLAVPRRQALEFELENISMEHDVESKVEATLYKRLCSSKMEEEEVKAALDSAEMEETNLKQKVQLAKETEVSLRSEIDCCLASHTHFEQTLNNNVSSEAESQMSVQQSRLLDNAENLFENLKYHEMGEVHAAAILDEEHEVLKMEYDRFEAIFDAELMEERDLRHELQVEMAIGAEEFASASAKSMAWRRDIVRKTYDGNKCVITPKLSLPKKDDATFKTALERCGCLPSGSAFMSDEGDCQAPVLSASSSVMDRLRSELNIVAAECSEEGATREALQSKLSTASKRAMHFQREAAQEEGTLTLVERSATSSAEEIEALQKRLMEAEDTVTHFVQEVSRLRRSQGQLKEPASSSLGSTILNTWQDAAGQDSTFQIRRVGGYVPSSTRPEARGLGG